MADKDPEVQRILEKARAQRNRLNKHLVDIGDSPHPIRSPLREKNAATGSAGNSPGKVVRTATFTKSDNSSSSPNKIRTNALARRVTAAATPEPDEQKETFNREVTERKTTVEGSPVRDGNRETYTRTTVTEKEEKVHKTQVVRFSGLSEEGVGSVIKRYADDSGSDADEEEDDGGCTTTTTKTIVEKTTRSRSPSPEAKASRSRSPIRKRTPSPRKAAAAFTPGGGSGIVTSARRQFAEYDEETFGESGRKKRLAALAKKFHRYDTEDGEEAEAEAMEVVSAAPSTPSVQDKSVTKEVDVDEELAEIHERAERNAARSPTRNAAAPSPSRRAAGSPTKNMARDPQFLKSLRAQGFEETESKTKLVYDFKMSESPTRAAIMSSPTKSAVEPRPTSPYKPHPLQFVSPQVSQAVAAAAGRGSPAGKATPPPSSKTVAGRPTSPYKPHPLQYVSPQRANNSPRAVPASEPPRPPPNKPARTWAAADMQEEPGQSQQTWRTETTVQVTSSTVTPSRPPAVPPKPPMSEPMTDTASRRSLAEKWSMFEGQKGGEPEEPSVDPAMMSLSERRALFEKNRTAPKPIARFGDAVTPSMLHRGQGKIEGGGNSSRPNMPPPQPKQLFKRAASPARSPPKKRAPSPPPAAKRPASPARNPPSPKRNTASPDRNRRSRSNSPKKMVLKEDWQSKQAAGSPGSPTRSEEYPGVNSLKRIKVSPPKPGGLYPQLATESSDDDNTRPNTAMSGTSEAASEAPSLGMAIKRAASAAKIIHDKQRAMPSISEASQGDEDQDMTCSEEGDIDDILDEALDDSGSTAFQSEGPTPPKHARKRGGSALSPTQSAASWEYETPQHQKRAEKFKTPLVEAVEGSPQGPLPQVEGEEGSSLLHTVSFYRRNKPTVSVTPHEKIVRRGGTFKEDDVGRIPREDIQQKIRKLQEECEEQRQRMEQASKALNFCVSQGEFEGSAERVEGERLLLEATHKHAAASSEIRRLTTEGAIGKSSTAAAAASAMGVGFSRGSISISGLALPLKVDFVRMLRGGEMDNAVHYFIVLFKYRHRVIATQMLSSTDGVSNGRLVFPNLINMRDLDFDFQIRVEVYGLQTHRESLPHEVKYHIRKDKSMFSLTPLKMLKKQDSRTPSRHQNPVNSKTIRQPVFGMVGYALINIDTLKKRAFTLDKVPKMSPLDGGLEMTLTIHSESKIEQKGFLTFFTDTNGYGDWCRRWCRLSGNTLHFWKSPEDEGNKVEPSERICLSSCVTENVSLAPREISSRMNTFMLETKRPTRKDDADSLVMHVGRKSGQTTIRHLLAADSRDERLGWCSVVNRALSNIRAWDPTAFRPRSASQGSHSSVDSASTQASGSTDIW